MRSETILLLCTLLSVIFAPTRSVVSIDRYDEVAVSDVDFNVTVTSTTTSSVTLKVEFGGRRPKNTLVWYHPRITLPAPADLRWDPAAGHFVASEIFVDQCKYAILFSYSPTGEIEPRSIRIPGLELPGAEYEFNIRNVFVDDTVETVQTVARTRPHIWCAPRTGAGFFHVYDAYEKLRTVRVYWLPGQVGVQYEVLVYEDAEEWSRLVYQETGPLNSADVWMKISLESHRFIFTSFSAANRSSNSSVVHVPAQKNLIPALSTNVRKNRDNDTIVLTWEPPTNASVSNYTIFWLDIHDGNEKHGLYVRDYVYVGGHENSFEAKAKNGVTLALGISVNTEIGSSGLQTTW